MIDVKIKNNKIDKLLEAACLMFLVGMVLFLCVNWSNIPDEIPAHYDWTGNIDRWGSKVEIVIVPVMTWFLYLMMTGFEQIPDIWNTGVKVTEENKERVYRTLKYMVKTLKLIVVIAFTYMTLCSAMGHPLSKWFGTIFVVLVFGDMIIWMLRLFKEK